MYLTYRPPDRNTEKHKPIPDSKRLDFSVNSFKNLGFSYWKLGLGKLTCFFFFLMAVNRKLNLLNMVILCVVLEQVSTIFLTPEFLDLNLTSGIPF